MVRTRVPFSQEESRGLQPARSSSHNFLTLRERSAYPDCDANLIPDECDLRPSGLGFKASQEISLGRDPAWVDVGDLDGDGDLDMATYEVPFTQQFSFLLNDGKGVFTGSGIAPVPADLAYLTSPPTGDLNGDGLIDLVWVNYGSIRVALQSAAGGFERQTEILTQSYVLSLVAGDWNRDGRIDLAMAGSDISVLLNRGDGTFFKNRALQFGTSPHSLYVATPDLNGDGLPDLAVAEDSRAVVTLSLNTTRPPLTHDENRNGIPDPCERTPFHRGDADATGAVELTDPIFILDHLFAAGAAPPCREAEDADNDGALAITDAIQLLLYLFPGGTPPAEPGPPPAACGQDADAPGAAGDLGCDSYGRC